MRKVYRMNNTDKKRLRPARLILLMALLALSILTFAACVQETPELPPPDDVTIKVEDGALKVEWTEVPGADCYYVYRLLNDGSDYGYWGVTQQTELLDRAIAKDTNYSYAVYPAITDGQRYYRADAYTVSGSAAVLSSPAIYSVTTAESGCTVKWSAVETATGYSVYRSHDADGKFVLIDYCELPEYTDAACKPDMKFYYYVTAKAATGPVESAPSATVSSISRPIINGVVRQDTYTAIISWWDDNSDVEYSVYRANAKYSEYEYVGTTKGERFYRDDTILYGDTYCYKVEAKRNAEGLRVLGAASEAAQITVAETSEVLVLMYHDFVSEADIANGIVFGEYALYPEEFEADLNYFKANGYTTMNAEDLLACLKGEASFPEKPVILTIDDGTQGVYRYAYPLLKEYGMKAVLSVIGANIDIASAMPDRSIDPAPYCTWDEIAEMSKSGVIEMASHSYTMHVYDSSNRIGASLKANEPLLDYKDAVCEDLGRLNEKLLSVTGKAPVAFAYPYSKRSVETDEIITKYAHFNLLFGTDDSRVTRMNHFISGIDFELNSPLLSRDARMTGRTIEGYFTRAHEYDYPTLEELALRQTEAQAALQATTASPTDVATTSSTDATTAP